MSILYFVPRENRNPLEPRELIGLGATWLSHKSVFTSTYTVSGPKGLSGPISAIGRPGGEAPDGVPFDAEHQKWIWHPSKKFLIGVDTRHKPGPEDLVRGEVLPGQKVMLLDNNEWVVPVCVPKLVEGMSGETLPMRMDLDEDGQTVAIIEEAFEEIAGRCYQYFQTYTGLSKTEIPFAAAEKLAVDLLSLNYQVDRVIVIGLLGLFGTRTWRRPLRAAIEADAIDEYVKQAESAKKATAGGQEGTASDGSATTSGSTGDATPDLSASAT